MSGMPQPSARAQRTRAALLAAGFELVAGRPIDAIPIDEFVAAAGVAKGSFFNHFADKQAFAEALAQEVRLDLEEHISRTNDAISDPIERMAKAMRVCARFAIENPKRTIVLLRGSGGAADPAHPLNKGVAKDFEDASRAGLLGEAAESAGVLYWLGLCQALMAYLIEQSQNLADAGAIIDNMLVLGLGGLGIERNRIAELAR
ncbi:MAG: TetR/AcrR family transcriptional regulator [Novosphingobium sp.]